jgi:hypothetical protein
MRRLGFFMVVGSCLFAMRGFPRANDCYECIPHVLQPLSPGGGKAQEQHEAAPPEEHHSSQNPERGSQDAPLFVVGLDYPQDHNSVASKPENESGWYTHPDWWVAGFTGALFVSTTGLWIFTWLLWRSTNRAVREGGEALALARDEFNASHRPQIVVHSVRLVPPDIRLPVHQRTSVPVAKFAIVNAGVGSCDITGAAVYLAYVRPAEKPYLPEMPPNDIISPRHLEVGATDNSITVVGVQSDEARFQEGYRTTTFGPGIDNAVEPDHWLYLSGWIVYADTAGNTRTTYFRRMYCHRTERFIQTCDPDDEATY